MKNIIRYWHKSDYFIQRPIIEEVRKSKKLEEVLVVTGAHLKKILVIHLKK